MKHYLRIPSIPREESSVSILMHEMTLIGSLGKRKSSALFDSGASYSIIRRDIAENLEPLNKIPDPENWVFETAHPGALVHAQYRVTLNFRFEDSEARFSDEFVVFDECSEEVVIGVKTLQAWSIKLDFEQEKVIYRKTAQRLRVL
jgi:hypothetical protein